MTQALAADLSTLFTDAPARPSMEVRYRAGVIKAWNPATLENIITVDGVDLVDLPVLGLAEADSYAVGTVVGLHLISSKNGSASWAIVGAFVKPGTAAAENALSRLAARVTSDDVATSQTTTSTSFTNLATTGPTVTMTVGASGKVLVTMSALVQFTLNVPAGVQVNSAQMSVQVQNSVPATVVAAGVHILQVGGNVSAIANLTLDCFISASRQAVIDGLNPGEEHTFQAKYRTGVSGASALFAQRVLTVERL